MSRTPDASWDKAGAAAASRLVRRPSVFALAALTTTLVIPAAFVLAPVFYPAELLCFFFLQILVAALIGCLLVWRRPGWGMRSAATAGLLASAVIVFAPAWSAESRVATALPAAAPEECLTVMTVNLLMTNRHAEGLEAQIATSKPDVVIVEEATRRWRKRIEGWTDYPYRASDQIRLTDIDVISRRPILSVTRPHGRRPDDGVSQENVRVEIAATDGSAGPAAVVYGLHAETPRAPRKWHSRNALLDAVARKIGEEPDDLPVVVGGDFNTPLWSPVLRRFAETARVVHLGTGPVPFSTRFLIPAAPLVSGAPIDHLFVNAGFQPARAEIGAPFGSDHLPVTARICPSGPAGAISASR